MKLLDERQSGYNLPFIKYSSQLQAYADLIHVIINVAE